MVMCDHMLGSLPCDNPNEHKGGGKGCTHTHGSYYQAESEEEE